VLPPTLLEAGVRQPRVTGLQCRIRLPRSIARKPLAPGRGQIRRRKVRLLLAGSALHHCAPARVVSYARGPFSSAEGKAGKLPHFD
jgi:hypothetical protein